MKKTLKKVITTMLAVVLILVAIPLQVNATYWGYIEQPKVIEFQKTVVYTLNPKKTQFPEYTSIGWAGTFGHPDPKYKITDIKSSNTAVATPFTDGEKSGTTTLNVYPHKAGTAIISCRVNGKTYKTKFIARKYVCPLTYIKLGSTTMTANKFKKTDEIHLSYRKYAKKNQKISVKPAKGWKIKGIYCSNGTKYMTEVKNNSSYFINTENDWYMYVFFINPTTQQKEFINIYLD